MNILEYETYQEKKPHGSPDFPYTTYLCSIPLDFTSVPLHWHDEFELIYIKKGSGLVTADLTACPVRAGMIVLILPGQLHSIQQLGSSSMEYENIIFHPNLLLAKQTDDCTRNFFQPLFSGALRLPTCIDPSLKNYKEIVSCIDAADEICKIYPEAYPFAIKSELFRFFFLLFSTCQMQPHPQKRTGSLDKMKLIIKYIECNYMNKISVAEIAAEAGFSQAHFMRYFKSVTGQSFVEYLNDYRLTMASRLLLASDNSVLAVASESGFDNVSYFNRLFRRKFGTTPSHYRKSR